MMNLKNFENCIDHDESVIRHFVEDPSYANLYLQTVLADGDTEEIEEVKGWINEARARVLEHEMELEVMEA